MTSDDAGGTVGKKRPSPGMLFLRDAGIAMIFVASVLLAMYAYTGLWPPLVVVESDSMMHSDDNVSQLGAIDTGDMVLVKDVGNPDDVVTYMEGVVTGHRTYGDFGDVIVYKKNGDDGVTPIIHRAMVYLEANPNGSYRCEALRDAPADKWSVSDGDAWDYLTSTLTIYHVGYRDVPVGINIALILSDQRGDPVDGFITKGDHNTYIDQAYRSTATPVDIDWVVGKARGEIPWFGLLKLWFTDSLKSEAPENSVHNLWISIAVIVIVPIVIDVVLTYRIRKKISRRREAAKEEFEREREMAEPRDVGPPPPPSDTGVTTEEPEPAPPPEQEPPNEST
ncbi:TPA: S26 family signal peptidase [Thermoplasmata archaeon]|nr:S26 family signal peptidase [Thermoplasmata archaeon]